MLPPSVLSFLAENLGMAFSLNFLCPFSYQLPDFALYLSIFLHLHCFHRKSVHKFSWNLFSSILTAFASIFLSKSIFCTVIREFLTNNDITAILKFLHWPSCLQIRVSALSVTWSEMNFLQSLISPLSLLLWVTTLHYLFITFSRFSNVTMILPMWLCLYLSCVIHCVCIVSVHLRIHLCCYLYWAMSFLRIRIMSWSLMYLFQYLILCYTVDISHVPIKNKCVIML